MINLVNGVLDKYNIIPRFFSKKSWDFYSIREVLALLMTTCWFLPANLTYFWRNINTSSIFYFSKSTSINTTQWSMGHSGDDVFHRRLQKIKTNWQNQLKSLVYLIVLYRIRHKQIDATLVQYPSDKIPYISCCTTESNKVDVISRTRISQY